MASNVVKLKQAEFSALATQKLESSGISPAQAAKLGMYDVANAATLDQWFEMQPALVIPYFGTDGKPLKAHPTWPEFYRARYLGEDKGFKAQTKEKKSRYVQPAGTGVCAYFPSCADWKVLEKDPTEPLCITEGELKAAKACLEGFPTIGLGGVNNFRAASRGVFFLPELARFVWPRRRVTIVYDSDYQTNPNICAAINLLAEELQERGANVYVAMLDDVYEEADKKTGLDDFLIERGDEALGAKLQDAEPLGLTTRLWQMNEEIVYVEDPGFIVNIEQAQKLPVANYLGHSKWATVNVAERKVRPNGAISYEKVSAAPVWLRWPLRRQVAKVTYAPGQDKFFEENGLHLYNQWKGWGVEPVKGDVKPWLELVKFIFEGAAKEDVEWFLDWCAYPIKYPGTKLFSSCLIHGRRTGTGKTLIFYTLKEIYGENFRKIKNEDLMQTWWCENTQFVLGDEISGSDKRSEADMLKTIVTQQEINVNVKFIPQFTVPDRINYGFTSNHGDSMFLEDEDRRQFVHEVAQPEPLPLAFYTAYETWLRKQGGASALMHWFLQRDLSKFNPKGPAPRTAARERMIVSGKSDIALWCRELMESPESKLRVGQMRHVRDLFTSGELLDFYKNETGDSKVTKNGLSRKMAEAGFKLCYGGQPVMVEGTQGRYFMVRNADKWSKVKHVKQLAQHIALSPVRD